ncbi:MAG: IclR family transcriptional regulator [Acidimicrobiales bacterium]|jgi:DNA-binding IclR family transcriptional regulator
MSSVRGGSLPGHKEPAHWAPVANRAALRALLILDLLSRSDEPMTLGEVATQLKLPKSSALTLLRALVVTEFCVADEKGSYALGLHSFEVGAAYLRSMTPVRSVTPELQWLTESLGVTSHFAVLEHDEVIYLAKHDPPGLGLKLASSLGARLPAAVTAVGKAQLAYHSAGLSRGGGGADHVGASGLELELEKVRRLGYAVDDGQTAVGIRCVAAPMFNDRGCCGAIGVSYLLGGIPAVTTVVGAVVEAAGRASARLGARGASEL